MTICLSLSLSIYIYRYMPVYIYICVIIYIDMYMYMYMYLYMYMYMYMYMYNVYVHRIHTRKSAVKGLGAVVAALSFVASWPLALQSRKPEDKRPISRHEEKTRKSPV